MEERIEWVIAKNLDYIKTRIIFFHTLGNIIYVEVFPICDSSLYFIDMDWEYRKKVKARIYNILDEKKLLRQRMVDGPHYLNQTKHSMLFLAY
jgi:hypothetical protein